MKICRLLLFFSCLIGTSHSLKGAVHERDFLTAGDGLLTYDDVNNREWLDLTETLDLAFTEVEEHLSTGGYLNGFTLATVEDLEGLADSAGVSWVSTPVFPGVEGAFAWELINLVGGFPRSNSQESQCCFVSNGVDYSDVHIIDILDALGFRQSAGHVSEFGIENTSEFSIIVSVFSFGEYGAKPVNLPVNSPPHRDYRSGGITLIDVTSAENSSVVGPYWLYRHAIPEPSCLTLLSCCMVSLLCVRRRIY